MFISKLVKVNDQTKFDKNMYLKLNINLIMYVVQWPLYKCNCMHRKMNAWVKSISCQPQCAWYTGKVLYKRMISMCECISINEHDLATYFKHSFSALSSDTESVRSTPYWCRCEYIVVTDVRRITLFYNIYRPVYSGVI